MSSIKRCSACKHCSEVPERPDVFICRGGLPKVFILPMQGIGGQSLQATTIWPQVNPDVDYCAKITMRVVGDIEEPTM